MGRPHGTLEIPFLKGHMGGNTIALFPGEAVSAEHARETVLQAIAETCLGCHEGALLFPVRKGEADLRLRIVGRASGRFITACGGLTQVLGAAIAEGELERVFGFGPGGTGGFVLETDGGPVRLRVSAGEGRPRTETDMTPFLQEIRRDGVERIELDGTPAAKVGKFLAVCADDLAGPFGAEAVRVLAPEVRDRLTRLQAVFLERHPQPSLDFVVFDLHPERPGCHGRVVFPHWIPGGHIEPACGTGTVAACVALELSGSLPGAVETGNLEVRFESGGGPFLGGPETTSAYAGMEERRIAAIRFSHSLVELTAYGKVTLERGTPTGS